MSVSKSLMLLDSFAWWDLEMPEQGVKRSEGEMVERIRWLIEDAVRLRMISDVPLGAFLSGGLIHRFQQGELRHQRRLRDDAVRGFQREPLG